MLLLCPCISQCGPEWLNTASRSTRWGVLMPNPVLGAVWSPTINTSFSVPDVLLSELPSRCNRLIETCCPCATYNLALVIQSFVMVPLYHPNDCGGDLIMPLCLFPGFCLAFCFQLCQNDSVLLAPIASIL